MLCDYREYRLSLLEWGRYLLEGAAACGLAAYVFYRSAIAFFLMLPAGFLWPFLQRKRLAGQRRERLRGQFREAVLILSSALAAGYSVENAFGASVPDLEQQYGRDGMITREFSYIAAQLRMNRTAEELLLSFAARSGIEEIESFAVIFSVSKRSRGELASVVNHVARVISDRVQVRGEIQMLTAEKQFEQKIMNLMPFGIVLYLDISSPGYFDPMYETAAGRIVMSVCLALYLGSCALASRILQIEV